MHWGNKLTPMVLSICIETAKLSGIDSSNDPLQFLKTLFYKKCKIPLLKLCIKYLNTYLMLHVLGIFALH